MEFYNQIEQYCGQAVAITEDGEHIKYEEFIEDCNQFQQAVSARKIVFIICKNTYEALVGYVGSLRIKAVPVLINQNLDKGLLNRLLDSYKPSYIYMPKEENIDNQDVIFNFRKYVLIKTTYVIDYELNKDLALLLTTSGSTGSPKLVRQSYKNITSNALSIAQYLQISNTDRPITTMPMNYTYGLSIINSHLLCGATIILTEKSLMDKEFWRMMKEYKATTFGGVPYIYEMLKKLRFEKMDLPHLKTITQAGGKLPKELCYEFAQICEEKNIKFVVMYGQTEATARMAYLPYEYAKSKAGSIGIAIPKGKFILIDEAGKEIQTPHTVGELVYYGDNVTLGYAENCFDLIKEDDNKGVLYTGDMAKKDEDGFYYIVGRKKRFLKIYGNRVNLDEIESLLKKEGFECACSGTDDRLVIFVTSQATIEKVREYVNKNIHINPRGFTIKYIEKIPRNEAGKILYSKLV